MNKTKRSIFESAIKVFSNSGYTGATMDEIASMAGVAKGSLYYHFKSKEELFYFIIEEGIELIHKEVQDAVAKVENPFERIKVSAKVQLRYVYENKDLIKVIMSQLWGMEKRNELLRVKIKFLLDESAKKFEAAINEGFIEKADPMFLSYSFIGMMFSSALYELLNEDDYDYDTVVEKFMTYLQYGIGVK